MKTIKWIFYYSLLIAIIFFYSFLYHKLYSLGLFNMFSISVLYNGMFIIVLDFIRVKIKPILIKDINIDKTKYLNKGYLVNRVLGYIPVSSDSIPVKHPPTKP